MPQAAKEPPKSVKAPPSSIEEKFTRTNEDGEQVETSAKEIAEEKIKRKKSGMTKTILTSPMGVDEDAEIYKKSLLS